MQSVQRSKSKVKVPSLSISNKENDVSTPRTRKSTSARDVNRLSVKLGGPTILSARPKQLRTSHSNSNHKVDHRFQKKTFSKPTWCQFANKFIWGLNKSGYECRVCGMAVSRRFIGEAKKTFCGEEKDGLVDVSTGQQVAQVTKSRVFTIYLPHGAKKSVLLNPTEPLRHVLEKVCRERGININEFVPEDTNGDVIDLETTLGQINGCEITFTKRDMDLGVFSVVSAPNIPIITSPRDKKNKFPEAFKKSRTKSQPCLDKVDTRFNSSPSNHSNSLDKSGGLTIKKSVIEMYDFGPELGSGAFSVVKAATHRDTQDVVAIKVLDKYEDDDEQTQKFKQEIKIISSLHHENIVRFYELDEDDVNFYVVMELVGGGELFDYIIDNGALPELEAVCVVAQVCKAIEYMHRIGTAHRDLKPENLLFKDTDHKVIKIADFGESKSFRESTLTTYCGTPDYMAPEIIRGENYGAEVDIWAIGVITYVMLAGFPPFDGENDVEVFASILSIRYDFPSPEWDTTSEEARNFIQSILIDDPKLRLTASQCLQHPWIVNNVTPELRTNSKLETSAKKENFSPDDNTLRTSSLDKKKTGKHRVEEECLVPWPALDVKRPKNQIKELVDETMRVIPEGSFFLGELKAMLTILEATSGKSGNDLEKVVYQTYHKRLREIQGAAKKIKKGKKK